MNKALIDIGEGIEKKREKQLESILIGKII